MTRILHAIADDAISTAMTRYAQGAGPREVGRGFAFALSSAPTEVRRRAAHRLGEMVDAGDIVVDFAAVAAVYADIAEMRAARIRNARRRARAVVRRVHRAQRSGRPT